MRNVNGTRLGRSATRWTLLLAGVAGLSGCETTATGPEMGPYDEAIRQEATVQLTASSQQARTGEVVWIEVAVLNGRSDKRGRVEALLRWDAGSFEIAYLQSEARSDEVNLIGSGEAILSMSGTQDGQGRNNGRLTVGFTALRDASTAGFSAESISTYGPVL